MNNLPPKDDYNYSSKTKKDQKEFDEWYEINKGNTFILAEELAAYCCNDTQILLHAIVKMQQLFRDLTNLDIFTFKTIASAVMADFKTNCLPSSEHLALITEKAYGFDRYFKQSTLARKFLAWYNYKNNVELATSETWPGEQKIGNYYVDGFLDKENRTEENNDRNLVVKIHGYIYQVLYIVTIY